MMMRDVRDRDVLRAMRTVPRHLFMPEKYRSQAYEDHPLPIGAGQTISQPYIVAKMTELAGLKKGSKVLEIGTGSGYQAAVLAETGAEVFTIEILQPLGEQAKKNLAGAGYEGIHTRIGDGYRGWAEKAPFDAVIVTAAPESVPEPLKAQLKVGGRLVIPVGASGMVFSRQELKVLTKEKEDRFREESVFPVAFVPMTGESQKNIEKK